MQKEIGKLELSKETLLSLDDQDLANAMGGSASNVNLQQSGALICLSQVCVSSLCVNILGNTQSAP